MAIKVHGRFATAKDTAQALGVPASRVNKLIDTVVERFRGDTIKRGRSASQAQRDSITAKKRSGKHVRVKTKSKAAKTHR